ncbi:sugar ABC transporter permease [Marvinbryantia formatexigens DSM 14469]|nr:sugar ABC transporter permease [Marvinbryantia formatexigens]UWO26392.1 sugar ABC transporter permease [Marvinbryantia formatexigens DSM 14469]
MNRKVKLKSSREYPFIYLAPTFIVLIGLVGVPMFNNIVRSFTNNGVFPVLDQYQRLFKDKVFLNDLKNTFVWLLYTVPFEMLFGLLIAVLLNSNIRFRKFWRTLFIVPWVIPSIVVCIVWKWIYNADYGVLNYLLYQLGIIDKYQLWVSSPKQALICVAAVYVWKITPFVLIMYLSGLQSISADIYEAAKLDGANWFRQISSITIPLLFPVMRSIILVSVIWSLNSFVYVYSISGGGPARASEIAQIFIYKTGIEQFNFEYSAAAANIFFLIVMAIAAVYIVVTEKKESTLV